MHELSIAISILDLASEESEARQGACIQAIHIRLGDLSGVVKEALVSAFELARECSPFPECRLQIEDVPTMIYCPGCDLNTTPESIQLLCCTVCGQPASEIVSGREMEIIAMEIEEPLPEKSHSTFSTEA